MAGDIEKEITHTILLKLPRDLDLARNWAISFRTTKYSGQDMAYTERAYTAWNVAYDFFNEQLFDNELPDALITHQRKSRTYGYYSARKFGTRDSECRFDEIALNPDSFLNRTTEQIMSTLVHEMVHQWQEHFGTPSSGRYHNKEWADKMEWIGLMPSSTGQPNGKRTGTSVTHYIIEDGAFADAVARLQFGINFGDFHEEEDAAKKRVTKRASKTPYDCPSCKLTAWAKPNTRLLCQDCDLLLMPRS